MREILILGISKCRIEILLLKLRYVPTRFIGFSIIGQHKKKDLLFLMGFINQIKSQFIRFRNGIFGFWRV